MVPTYDLPHIDLSQRVHSVPYKSTNSNQIGAGTPRVREEHGARLRNELANAYRAFDEERRQDPRIGPSDGTFLEVELKRGSRVETVERKRRARFVPGSAQLDDQRHPIVGLYVADESRNVFEAILREYEEGDLSENGRPPMKDFAESIESIRQARLETYFTDDRSNLPPPGQEMWWEVWCLRDLVNEFEEIASKLQARIAEDELRLYFPEHVVLPVLADRATIELMLFARLSIVELRRVSDSPTFYLENLDRHEQWEVAENLAVRTEWPGFDAPAVCLLDTGVNRAHILIEPTLAESDLTSVKPEWGVDDSVHGHGTGMAGLALFGDLTPRFSESRVVSLRHRLESVKILPPSGFTPTEEHLYGAVMKQGIATLESIRPQRRRVFCLAVTNEDKSGFRPTAWSSAIDQEAAGVTEIYEKGPKRLFVVSTGNAPNPIEVDQIVDSDSLAIEDPAQAWNAITVGGYTEKINIQESEFAGYSPYASAGSISPYSRTSIAWDQGRSPFKPDIVLEAGNRVVSPSKTDTYDADSLALLSTGANTERDPITSFRATSAATAQAARLATRLIAEFPDYWPETIRALIVHGAEWTPAMREELHNAQNKSEAYLILRRYGHGVPTFERASASARNHVAIVAQAEIQPFSFSEKKMNECHFYSLPWPQEVFEELGEKDVRLKITLSYFIEPNPGSSASFDPYRYRSYGLRFDLKRRSETDQDFAKRVNKEAWDSPKERPRAQSDDDRWLFGANSMSTGSLHSDEWTGPAAHLMTRNHICIKPVGGWWLNRAKANIRAQKARYAVVLSLHSDENEVDLHTPITAIVETALGVETITLPNLT